MKESIRQALTKCVFANVNNYDEATNTIIIPKYKKPKYEIGKCYLVKVPQDIINNANSILAINWNNGTSPQYEYLKIYVAKALGTYIKVDAIYYDIITKQDLAKGMFSGYLDTTTLEQLAIL